MSEFKSQDFSGKRVELDGNRYENCKFQKAEMIYSGGDPPEMINCDCTGATLSFEGAAERTARFMRGLSRDPFMVDFIRLLFPNLGR